MTRLIPTLPLYTAPPEASPVHVAAGYGLMGERIPAEEHAEPVAWRPEVRAMPDAMEAKLREHDASRGDSWKVAELDFLLDRLAHEVRELRGAVRDGEDVLGEAADVANFAMMIADRRGSLPAPQEGSEMPTDIEDDGTAWIHDLDAHKRMHGTVFGWSDERSETGMLSGIVIDTGMLCVRVKDICAAIIKRESK